MILYLSIVIPGRPAEARRAKADEPGIQKQLCASVWIPGPALRAVPE